MGKWEDLYVIIKQNYATLKGMQLVGVAKGEAAAERLVDAYTAKLTKKDRAAGWLYFSERSRSAPFAIKHKLRSFGKKSESF